ncbi:MAG: hypothetical protein QNJ55_15545 [Xenococcus sp. MO_188.B8]|nr:hypothetical protein [Xenococcus sp. MO_188.B8]
MTIKINDHENQQQITAQSAPSCTENLEDLQQVEELAIDDWDLGFATLSEEEIEKLID